MKKKYLCLFCDGECSIEAYKNDSTTREIEAVLAVWKVCTTHAQELEAIRAAKERQEIERSVA